MTHTVTEAMAAMSAQIITALRKRAEALDDEADLSQERGDPRPDERGEYRSLPALRFLASEFRALADQAEAPPAPVTAQPGSIPWQRTKAI